MTQALTLTEKTQLLAELDEAGRKSSNSYATGYRDMRRVLTLWGYDVDAATAQRIYRDLSNEITPASSIEPSFKQLTARHAAAKVAVKVGMTITYSSPLGEPRTGVVTAVSKSGKSIDVVRPDGSRDIASRNVQVA